MINAINNTSFRCFRRYSTHTPKMQPFPEGYFMRKSPFAKDYVPPLTFGEKLRNQLFNLAHKITSLFTK